MGLVMGLMVDLDITDQWVKLNMHNINTADTLWPKLGDWLIYNGPDLDFGYYSEPDLKNGHEYEVYDVKFIPCADKVKVMSHNNRLIITDLYNFKFKEFEV